MIDLIESNEYISLIFRCVLFYIVIIVALRIMGKREVGELSVLDIVIYFVMSEVFAMSIASDEPMNKALLAIIVLVILQFCISFACLKSKKIRDFFEGKPVLIIENGVLDQKMMKKQRYTIDDLLYQLRDKGAGNVEDVKFALLENSGVLSVLLKNDCLMKHPFPLISDGIVQYSELKNINRNIQWLVKELGKINVINVKDVFICIYQQNGLFVIMKDKTDINKMQ